MRRPNRARLSVTTALVILTTAACTSGDAETKQPTQATRTGPPSPSSEVTSGATAQPSVQQPPELDSTETLAGLRQKTKGNASFAFGKGQKGDALIVAVRCQGKGTMKVAVTSVNVSFPLECLADEVTTTYNQVGVSGVEHSGTVSVEAPTSVHWSMTIGRGRPATPEPPAQTS